MDRALNPKNEKQTIYEIYRACRLCGAGAGYKMPIIQSVVDLEGDGVELRQKIRECLQIEVNNTDRMPPLICELCVDKVNDFYVFFELCQQTNKRTRFRLGLPQQTLARDSPDSEKCILGVTEPVYVDDSDGEPLAKRKSKKAKVKLENSRNSPKPESSRESRESSEEPWRSRERRKRAPSPPRRATRQTVDRIQFEETDEVPMLKRLRGAEVKIDTPPPLKKVKLTPEPAKIAKPGPKSSKNKEPQHGPRAKTNETTPSSKYEDTPISKPAQKETISGLKSKTRDIPGPKSKTRDIPSPKSKTKNLSGQKLTNKVLPGPKSKTQKEPQPRPKSSKENKSKTEVAPSKTEVAPSKTEVAPSKTEVVASKSSKKEQKVSPSPKARPKPPPKPKEPPKELPSEVVKAISNICFVCDAQCKTSHGLTNHMYKHSPSFTSLKHACNPCELWFPNRDIAATHHRNHRNNNVPYKCTRCYGYFKLLEAYDEHFDNNLCLSIYEVPDVKCWECWLSFPTTKLMEEHRCAGEDGRPGGNCKKCNRNYSLLKNLIKHESTCNYRKKGEVLIDPEIQARLLSMEVRVVRCDALLPTLPTAGSVDATKLSQKFGLDSSRVYPYLTVEVKTEPTTKPFGHMVAINDDVKTEFSTETIFKHFDSDNSDKSESDSDTSKTVDSLGSVSLNKVFNKGIGKRRKVKSEIDDMSMKIDSIIDNLAEDTHNSYDSDSILDKNIAKDDVKSIDVAVGKVNQEIDERSDKLDDAKVKDTVTGIADVKTSEDATETETNNDIMNNDGIIGEDNAGIIENESVTRKNDEEKASNDKEIIKDSAETDKDDDIKGGDDEKPDKVDAVEASSDEKSDKDYAVEASSDETPDKDDAVEACSDENPDKDYAVEASSDKKPNKDDAVGASSDEKPDKNNAIPAGDDERSDDGLSKNNETVGDIKKDECTNSNESPMMSEKDDSQTSCSIDSDSLLDKITNKANDNDSTVDSEMKTDEATTSTESSKTDDILNEDTKCSHSTPLEDTNLNDKDVLEGFRNQSSNEDTNVSAPNDENEQNNITHSQAEEKVTEGSIAVDEIKNGDVDSNKLEETNKTQDTFQNVSDKMDVDERNDQIEIKPSDISNFDLNIQRSPNNEDLSKIDEITSKILQENEDSHTNYSKINAEDDSTTKNKSNNDNDDAISSKIDESNNDTPKIPENQTSQSNSNHESPTIDDSNEDTSQNHIASPKIDKNYITPPKSGPQSDEISLTSVNGVESRDKYNVNDLSDDDRKLMAELDAQIGENETKQAKSHLIDDLLRKPDDLKSLDLDSISDDEFNFDA